MGASKGKERGLVREEKTQGICNSKEADEGRVFRGSGVSSPLLNAAELRGGLAGTCSIGTLGGHTSSGSSLKECWGQFVSACGNNGQ